MEDEKCDGCEEKITLTSFCINCGQCYCTNCTTVHTRQRATREHMLLRTCPETADVQSTKIGINCEICESKKEVISLCVICRELYCNDCTGRHHRQRAVKHHNLVAIQLRDSSQTFKPVQSVAHNKAQVQVQPLQVLEKNLYKGNLFVEKSCSAPGETEITRIRGITFIADGRLVIIDGKNKNIKIFQPEWFDLVARKELVDEPRGISCISQDDIVITFADKKEVRVYRIDKANNLWKQRSFGMKDKPFSISCSKKTFAIEIGEGDDGMIAVTDFNGNITHLVRGHNANFGQFTGNTIRLVHDNDSKRLFVVNVDGYIHCVDYYGEVKWFIKINTPRGVALHENTLFVASKVDNKIYQVNTGNGNMYDLLSDKDRTRQPRYIAFHPSKGKMAVEVGSNINFYTALKPSK